MFIRGVLIAGLVFSLSGLAGAENGDADTAAPLVLEDATPVEDVVDALDDVPKMEVPTAPTIQEFGELPPAVEQLSLKYQPLFEMPELNMAEEISIDLIDLESLREAIAAQVGRETLRLTLAEAIGIALQQNPDVLIASYEPLMADADEFTAKGEFDPIWQTNFNFLRAQAALSQQQIAFGGISAIDQYQTTFDSSVSGRLHTGTVYNFAFNINREESTFGRFITDYQSQGVFTLSQPLLRGFGRDVNRVRILAARNNIVAGEEQFRLTIMNTVAEVIKAYWDLVGAIEGVAVREESLANAERLYTIADTRREIGTAADIEVLQSKAGVATRQSDLVAARSAVSDASSRLKLILGLTDGQYFSKAMIVPIDRPNLDELEIYDIDTLESNLDKSVEAALVKRPEIKIAELQINNASLDERRARNEMLPQFDVNWSYGQGGRAPNSRESIRGIQRGDDFFYSYGFQASVPLRNRAARGQHTRARLMKEQTEMRLEQTRHNIMFSVHLALQQVVTNSILVESNRQATRLQEANVIAEENRLRLGVSTPWQVLQVQEELTMAQTQRLQAQIAYEKALVDLELAEGALLDKLDITYETPEAVRPTGYFESIQPRWR